ncbi:PLP-dependent aminotransferase family protein [Pseudomonas sp. Pseusp122]|uniref:aminotransferase-like domain-containing protein n=1 Tax=unclassified Pseudomonas TaxID=196821 RepID=UPI0039A6E500
MNNKMDFAYQAVYRYLLRLINEQPGDSATRLPSLRQLAKRLQVSISTVQSAYTLLEKEGRVRTVAKSGYFALAAMEADVGLDRGNADLLESLYCGARRSGMLLLGNDEPWVLKSLDASLLTMERELLRHYPRPFDPTFQPFGDIELRTALAARYTVSSRRCWLPENVYVGADLCGMLSIVLETLQLRGATVLVMAPCSWRVLRLLESFAIRVLEVPLEAGGAVNLPALDQALLSEPVGLVLVPSLLNCAQGSCLPLHNRHELAELLNRYRVWVLEDDSHGELAFEASQEHLRHLIDPERLIILGTFARMLGSEAPFGYLLCQHRAQQFQQHLLLRSFALPVLRQKALARLYSNGVVDQHLTQLRQILEHKMLSLAHLLEHRLGHVLHFEMPRGGAVIWAHSAQPVDMQQVFRRLLQRRIVIAPGQLFSLQGHYRQNLRISYAIDWSEDVVAAIEALGEALHQARNR